MPQTTVQISRGAVEQAVTRFFHMANSHCPGNLAPLLTPDVELLADDTGKGPDAVNSYFVRLWEAYPCIQFVVENVITDGQSAAAEVIYDNGPGNKGARCVIFHFRGGLIRRIRCY